MAAEKILAVGSRRVFQRRDHVAVQIAEQMLPGLLFP